MDYTREAKFLQKIPHHIIVNKDSLIPTYLAIITILRPVKVGKRLGQTFH